MTDKKLVKCQFCGGYFEFDYRRPQKKFCSWINGKRECYKKYHSRKSYRRRKEADEQQGAIKCH